MPVLLCGFATYYTDHVRLPQQAQPAAAAPELGDASADGSGRVLLGGADSERLGGGNNGMRRDRNRNRNNNAMRQAQMAEQAAQAAAAAAASVGCPSASSAAASASSAGAKAPKLNFACTSQPIYPLSQTLQCLIYTLNGGVMRVQSVNQSMA